MRAITGVVSVSRYFSTSKHLQILNFSGTKAELVELEEEEEEEKNLYFRALDGYPDLFTLKRLHSEIVSNRSLKSNPCLVIKLMRAFAALGDADTTRHMFDEFPRKNVIFYNVMIRSYVNNNMYYNALVLYASMLGSGIRPDNYTFPCVLKACSGCENLRVGLQIHAALRVGLDANLFVGNGLISMYGKCDLLCDARRVLDGMRRKDVVSWNSMLAVFARNGRFDEGLEKSLISWNVMIVVYVNNSMPDKALELFSQMETNGIEPDVVTLASVLPACGDLSALTPGRQIHEYVVRKKLCPNLILENALVDMYYFRLMVEELRIPPKVEHFACMVDIFGRSGCVDEAYNFIKEMPLEPNERVWGAPLGACRIYSNMSLGLIAIDHLFRLVPTQLGCTPFLLVIDHIHKPNEIYAELDVLVSKMKEDGYVPEMDSPSMMWRMKIKRII
ncbi:hypothetical protein Scep_002772 [Stephania cephalantha]|uniref:Pentatricopeptide repeat-containing protein n=1 Tax=Stephania cephalantha TaxID=152367 RepID=A0AAP0LAU6_9MAGN